MSLFEEKAREIARSTTDQLRGSTDAGPFHLAHHIPSMRKFIDAISLALGEAFEAGRNSMCQADLGAKCGDGVGLRPLHPGNGGEALDRGLPRQLSIHLCAQDE